MTDPYWLWREPPHPMDDPANYPEARLPERVGATWCHEETLNMRHFAFSQGFAKGLLDQRIDIDPHRILPDQVMARIRYTMLGKSVPDHAVTETRHFHVEVYDSPWQHFKANHDSSWWLRWLVRRRPVRTHKVTHKATLTATWEQFIGFPWQSIVSHLDPYGDRLGPAVRLASVRHDMSVWPSK